MAVTVEEVNDFHRFAMERLSVDSKPATMDDLLMEWQDQHDHEDVNAAIRRGLADIAAGRHQSAEEAAAEIEAEFGLPRK